MSYHSISFIDNILSTIFHTIPSIELYLVLCCSRYCSVCQPETLAEVPAAKLQEGSCRAETATHRTSLNLNP